MKEKFSLKAILIRYSPSLSGIQELLKSMALRLLHAR